jgi:hypothetical protein
MGRQIRGLSWRQVKHELCNALDATLMLAIIAGLLPGS